MDVQERLNDRLKDHEWTKLLIEYDLKHPRERALSDSRDLESELHDINIKIAELRTVIELIASQPARITS